MIAHLNNEIDFYVITRNTDYCETNPYNTIKSNEWNKLPNGEMVYYLSEEKISKKEIAKLILATPCDYYYVNGVFSNHFSISPLRIIKEKQKIIVSTRGMFAPSALSIKPIKKKLFLSLAKLSNHFSGITFHATNAQEAADIKKALGDEVDIKLAGNLPQITNDKLYAQQIKEEGKLKIVNIARIAPEKNLLYALEVLAAVKNSSIEFDIYGPVYDAAYWKKCEQLATALPKNIVCTYKGAVESDKVMEVLSAYNLMFMPTLGENFGHVILQSLQCGVPVLISNKTPWHFADNKNIGADLSLDNKDDFIKTIERYHCLNNNDYKLIASEARQFALKYTSSDDLLKSNYSLFNIG
jgi:glycosyltransferase involved in cell wall biosynthesis